MSKQKRKEVLKDLQSLFDETEILHKKEIVLAEDLSYKLKLYIRELGIDREEWCSKNGLSFEVMEEDLANENLKNLSSYIEVILTGKSSKVIRSTSKITHDTSSEEYEKLGLSRIKKSLSLNDPEKLWNAISYYILMNHKNIQQFCNDLSEKNFTLKYSTFRTDKYNKGLNSAVKYAKIILEFNE